MSIGNDDNQIEKTDALSMYIALGWNLLAVWWMTVEGKCACGRSDCPSPGKHPIGQILPHGVKDATDNVDVVIEWFNQFPDANVGVATGSASGIFAVDIDPRHSGEESFDELIAGNGELDTAVEQLTGGGGRHLIFQHPGRHTPCRTNVLPGIDIRGDGGYIVVEPSIHLSGHAYRWELSNHPSENDVSNAPEWLLDLISDGSGQASTSEPSLFKFDPSGSREVAIAKAALAGLNTARVDDYEHWVKVGMILKSVDPGPAMLDVWDRWSAQSDKYKSGECARKWQTFNPNGEVGLPTLMRMVRQDGGCIDLDEPETSDDRHLSSLNSLNSQPGETEKPRPWPDALDDAAFHGLAGEIVRVIEPHTEADPAALLVQLLVSFGSSIGRSAHFIADGALHHLNLFTVLVGRTSKGRKGTSWNHISRLFRNVDNDWATKRVLSGLSSGEGLIWAVRDAIYKQEPVKSKGKHTGEYEQVQVDPGVDDKRLLAMEAEFASMLQVMGRPGNTLSAIVRQAWDQGDLRTLTKNSPAQATAAHISIVGHVTDEELRRELTNTQAANGFANRFLFVCVRRSKFLPEGGQLSSDSLTDIWMNLLTAVEFGREAGELRRDDDSRRIWHAVYPELSDGKPGLLGAVTSRAEAQVMRLACIYALLDQSAVIRPEHMMAALSVWQYCEQSAGFVFGTSLGDPVADDILRSLIGNPDGLSRTDIHRLFKNHRRSEQIDGALATLQQLGRARCETRKTRGRPTEVWFAENKNAKKAKKAKKDTA